MRRQRDALDYPHARVMTMGGGVMINLIIQLSWSYLNWPDIAPANKNTIPTKARLNAILGNLLILLRVSHSFRQFFESNWCSKILSIFKNPL